MVMDRNRIKGLRIQSTLALVLSIVVVIALINGWLDVVSIMGRSLQQKLRLMHSPMVYSNEFDCSHNCSEIPLFAASKANSAPPEECPEYLRWIHEDLKPWKDTGITKETVEQAKSVANIRITIINGRLYIVKYKRAFQTRDIVTLWGLLQLLRQYPGRLPDLDLMFELGDRPVIHKRDYYSENASIPSPVFHYCSDESSYHIVFPDWSFWGWPEVNIKPWEQLKEEIREANGRLKWNDREPYAFWKGNSKLGAARRDLVTCNASEGQDWKARIYGAEWAEAQKQGFNNTDLASQCTHRYKIYVEGVSWSVSQKYILACDSMTLVVKPHYYDFFTRSLMPTIHYWPIREKKKCEAIKFAVEWGNKNAHKAQEIGRAGSSFVQENLTMKHIYDYSFHVLNEYAKLLKYKPAIPEGAVEICSETFVCSTKGRKRRFLKHSMVKGPAEAPPCILPPPYEPETLVAFLERKENLTNQVVSYEDSHVTGT